MFTQADIDKERAFAECRWQVGGTDELPSPPPEQCSEWFCSCGYKGLPHHRLSCPKCNKGMYLQEKE